MNSRPVWFLHGVREAIVADCDACRPEEACGVLIADANGRIVASVPVPNVWPVPAERVRRFSIDPLAQMRVECDAEKAGRMVAGYYHSHPTGLAVPSEFDLGLAWPHYIYLIAGYSDGVCVEFRVWILDDSRAFVEHAVEIEQ